MKIDRCCLPYAKKAMLIAAVLATAVSCVAAEKHADVVVAQILENVAKIKAANPDAVPMAFWDFDGTIIRGDISEGVESVDGYTEHFITADQSETEGCCP